jgi:hypothetical protein
LYIADFQNNRVRKITPSGTISTVAGNGGGGFGGDGGPATNAQIHGPAGVAIDRRGNMYITDYANRRVRRVDTAGIITTFAGTGVTGYSGDGGPATAAQLCWGPIHIAVDNSGNVYVADPGNNVVRKINAFGIISTAAGTGSSGFSGDGGPATAAQLCNAFGVAVDKDGNLLIGSNCNHIVRRVASGNNAPAFIAGAAASFTVCPGLSLSLDTTLQASDADTAQWISWAVISGPYNGVATASYSSITNRDTLLPTGLNYTPTAGYLGPDSLTVAVSDGYLSDTIILHLSMTSCSAVTGVAENSPDEIQIFPNPASSLLNVITANDMTAITIMNMPGQTVLEGKYDGGHVSVNIGGLPTGVYIIKVNNGVVRRFVKW